jgi:hypothetical protein
MSDPPFLFPLLARTKHFRHKNHPLKPHGFGTGSLGKQLDTENFRNTVNRQTQHSHLTGFDVTIRCNSQGVQVCMSSNDVSHVTMRVPHSVVTDGV